MKRFTPQWLAYLTSLLFLGICRTAQAQIIPDSTLPTNSAIPPDCIGFCTISGGTQADSNLFHSFESFSVRPQEFVLFEVEPTVQHIFTRVTGSQVSNIDGSILILNPGFLESSADFFLLNPNGVLFGPDATLTLGGSFITTTASRLRFADGFEFSATAPNAPLLTMSQPVGLQFSQQPQPIRYQSFSQSFDFPMGQTVALIGGEIEIAGGQISAPESRIEIASLGAGEDVGLAEISQGWAFDYDRVSQFGSIKLNQQAILSTAGSIGGQIRLSGQTIDLTEGSRIRIDARSGESTADLILQATQSVTLTSDATNRLTRLLNTVSDEGSGERAKISIQTPTLQLLNGSQITTGTRGSGTSPGIEINAAESIALSGSSLNLDTSNQTSGIFARVADANAGGRGGAINLTTPRLTLEAGGQISTDTFGMGDAGNLSINAQTIQLSGRTPDNQGASGFFSQVSDGASGRGGQLSIETERLEVRDGAQISTAARSDGIGGNIEINAQDVLVSGTANVAFASEEAFARSDDTSNIAISTEERGDRAPGSLTLNSQTLTIEAGGRISGDNFGTGETLSDGTGSGDRGSNLNLNVNRLIVREGGQIRTASFGAGVGGSLNIQADTIQIEEMGSVGLDNLPIQSALLAQAESSGNAGNINFEANAVTLDQGLIQTRSAGEGLAGTITALNLSTLQMQNGSLILADAGGNVDGGNIILGADFVLALPEGNNDIIANAVGGNGGQIDLSQAQAIFNFELNNEPRVETLRNNRSNDISASSQFGSPGIVNLNGLNVDPSQSLSELPTGIVDESQAIARRCAAQASGDRSDFYITGRGGLPMRPNAEQASEFQTSQIRSLQPTLKSTHFQTPLLEVLQTDPLQEATSWHYQASGVIELRADRTAASLNSSLAKMKCS